ncbi:MAG TPA: hypothetical protein VNF72_15905 [Myxococcota bacterium]|nr:hypothetical protein [Myxococcota bacterium]
MTTATLRDDLPQLALVAALASALHVGVAVAVAARTGIPLQVLGVFFDGHFYLEIARSFPLPYGPEALDYAGLAPAYPALAWLLHGALGPLVNWGGAMLLATWLPAVASALLFHRVCRALALEPLLPTLLFVVANPRWIAVAAPAHPEPLAMAAALASLLAFLKERPAASALWLCLAALARFPALWLAGPLALGIVLRRPGSWRGALWFAAPAVALALWHVYLELRVPAYTSVFAEHQVFWDTHPTWPFAALIQNAFEWIWPPEYPLAAVTYATLVFYLFACAVGFRAERALWVLPLWVLAQVLFHVSLAGVRGAWDFSRLALLAWPAALLAVWRLAAPRVSPLAGYAIALVLLGFGVAYACRSMESGVVWQKEMQAFLLDTATHLDEDTPRWKTWR